MKNRQVLFSFYPMGWFKQVAKIGCLGLFFAMLIGAGIENPVLLPVFVVGLLLVVLSLREQRRSR